MRETQPAEPPQGVARRLQQRNKKATPNLQDAVFNRIITGDARLKLATLPESSIDLSFWSPPLLCWEILRETHDFR